MYYNRIIPCLLLSNQGLVKTVKFKKPQYIGDPINAVKIFNDKEVDELVFLDIDATREGRHPNFTFLRNITAQCFMPLCYGGGVRTIEDIKALFAIGFEKVAINACGYEEPNLLRDAAAQFGSQSIIGSMDVKKDVFGRQYVWIHNGKKCTKKTPIEYAQHLTACGVGEIFLNNIDTDGMMQGYDLEMVKGVADAVDVPVISCGGAGNLNDMGKVVSEGHASAAAAGSLFVFWGENKAVLINYPSKDKIAELFV